MNILLILMNNRKNTRLITSLTDIVLFPALLLATEYHRRWEVENTIDELKVHHKERKTGGGAAPAPL